MTNGILAMLSKWQERLRLPKCDRQDDPQVWATSFSHLATLSQKGQVWRQ